MRLVSCRSVSSPAVPPGRGTELRSKIRNGTGLTERSFLSCIAQKKKIRPLDYVHNASLECATVH